MREVDFSCVKVVYRSKSSAWRGFVDPFNLSIEAESFDEVSHALDEMLDAYYQIFEEYGRPSHLTNITLSDDEDHDMFRHLMAILESA